MTLAGLKLQKTERQQTKTLAKNGWPYKVKFYKSKSIKNFLFTIGISAAAETLEWSRNTIELEKLEKLKSAKLVFVSRNS